MTEIPTTDALLNQVFQLAYFILRDRTASICLSMAAIDKLKIASAVQDRRQGYAPAGRNSYQAARNRVVLSRLHLLQRLVYAESEPFERVSEVQEGAPRQHDLIVRFVKHLVMITTKRNSFYVALGLCRLLYNYSTAETAEIYNFLLQDPDRSRDDYYYRKCKQQLMHEVRGRFSRRLTSFRGPRGEERFQAHEDPLQYAGLVGECLSRFTPWDSSCVLPAGIDPAKDVATPLLFRGGDPDHEHEFELNRIHTLLHPDCLERVAATLGIDPPSRRLLVPRFSVAGDDSGSGDDRLNPRPLSRDEIEVMRAHLVRSEARRDEAPKRMLAVLIDGRELACFEADGGGGFTVETPEGSEWAEVQSVEAEGGVALAVHALPFHEGRAARAQTAVARGGGHEFEFSAQQAGDSRALTVAVRYRAAGAGGLLSSLARRLSALRLGEGAFNVPRPYLAFGLLLASACLAGSLLYIRFSKAPPARPPAPEREQVVRQDGPGTRPQPPAPATATKEPPHSGDPSGTAGPRGVKGRGPDARGRTKAAPPSPTPSEPRHTDPAEDADASRGDEVELPSTALIAVRRVYVDPLGEGAAGRQAREALLKSLRASARFTVVDSRGEADAVFQGFVRREAGRGDGVTATVRLVNIKGEVIWTTETRSARRAYAGHPSSVFVAVIRDLLADIQRLEAPR